MTKSCPSQDKHLKLSVVNPLTTDPVCAFEDVPLSSKQTSRIAFDRISGAVMLKEQ